MSHNNRLSDIYEVIDAKNGAKTADYPMRNMSHNSEIIKGVAQKWSTETVFRHCRLLAMKFCEQIKIG